MAGALAPGEAYRSAVADVVDQVVGAGGKREDDGGQRRAQKEDTQESGSSGVSTGLRRR
jgi:DhnA family fructose-bisphosphate aldolase class Ia